MKRNCNGCRALNSDKYCDLGYKIEKIQVDFITIGTKPLENCPKPKTNNEYIKFWLQR
jgi:hypothetical protein